LRSLVQPEKIAYIRIEHKCNITRGRFILGTVIEVTPTEVILKKERIPFDYLYICTGSSYPSNCTHITADNSKKDLSAKDLKGVRQSFRQVVSDPYEYQFFKKFCVKEHAEENLLFIETVDTFNRLATQHKFREAKKLAKQIIHKFIEKESFHELNLDTHTYKNVMQEFENCKNKDQVPAELFAPAKKAAIANLSSHVKRFILLGNIKESSRCLQNQRSSALQRISEMLKKAESVVVIGGGPVGFELIGEITMKYPEKKVTLIEEKKIILDRLSKSIQTTALKMLAEKNVTVILREKSSKV